MMYTLGSSQPTILTRLVPPMACLPRLRFLLGHHYFSRHHSPDTTLPTPLSRHHYFSRHHNIPPTDTMTSAAERSLIRVIARPVKYPQSRHFALLCGRTKA